MLFPIFVVTYFSLLLILSKFCIGQKVMHINWLVSTKNVSKILVGSDPDIIGSKTEISSIL